jgi:hypothetical protein
MESDHVSRTPPLFYLSVSPKYEIDVHDREMLDLHRNSCKYVNVGYTAYASSNFPNDDLGIVKTVVLA